jgi:hypothetical protein
LHIAHESGDMQENSLPERRIVYRVPLRCDVPQEIAPQLEVAMTHEFAALRFALATAFPHFKSRESVCPYPDEWFCSLLRRFADLGLCGESCEAGL